MSEGHTVYIPNAIQHQPSFLPQPSDIEILMKEKFAHLKIDDEFGFTGEWRMSAKNVLDVIIDLQR